MDGHWVDSHQDLEAAFLEFYEGLLRSRMNTRTKMSQTIVNEGVTLSEMQQQLLCRSFIGEEVKLVLFDIR